MFAVELIKKLRFWPENIYRKFNKVNFEDEEIVTLEGTLETHADKLVSTYCKVYKTKDFDYKYRMMMMTT